MSSPLIAGKVKIAYDWTFGDMTMAIVGDSIHGASPPNVGTLQWFMRIIS